MEFVVPDFINQLKSDNYMAPEDLTYWKARQNRTFFIDYEIDEMYNLIELGKIIIQMNMEERDIPKEELKPIYIYIHSFGGDTYQSNCFCDICISSRIPIITVAMGAVMSAGFDIFIAGHRRYVFEHSQMLVHAGYANFSGTASEVEEAQKNYKKQQEESKKYILERTKIDSATFNKNKNKDWYLTMAEIQKFEIGTIVKSFDDIV